MGTSVIFLLILLYSRSSIVFSTVQDGEALLQFKKTLGDPDALKSWVPNMTPCGDRYHRWTFILCNNDGSVMGIGIHNTGLSGKIDIDALTRLPGLRTISLRDNNFTGPIPDFHRLVMLKSLYLSNNKFSGPIPSDYFSKADTLKKLWVDNNQFSGDIPPSMGTLQFLQELHLEKNNFTGKIPSDFKQPPLLNLDLSNNQLEGEIPAGLSNFNASSFAGNLGLCGAPVGKECDATATGGDGADAEQNMGTNKSNNMVMGVGVVLSVGLLFLLLAIIFTKKRQNNDIPRAGTAQGSKKRGMNDGVVEVQMNNPALGRKDSDGSTTSRKSSGSSRKSSSSAKGGSGNIGDLTVINDSRGLFGMADLMKASAEVLGNGGMGSAYKAVMGSGVAVAVKRIRELNRLDKDAFDVEIRKLASLRHPNVLPPLAYHYRKEEKLVVSEYVAKGSLHFLLHGDRGASHGELTWPIRLNIIKCVTQGLEFLHTQLTTYDLPHGNLKTSNILINKDNEALLSDYGLDKMANPKAASQSLFGYKSPEALQNLTPKCDIYCLGVVILEILTGKFPSQYLSSTKGGTDVVQWVGSAIEEGRETDLLDSGMVSKSTVPKEKMAQLLHVGVKCTDPDPKKRPSFKEIMDKINSLEGQES